ncbi:MAG: retropepsin-like domain-containing protein [Gammaproteobacteria bacterium]|nr:retropepsin-like domain-containing protein [Gammaproteobacteria bacterium]
MPVRLLTCLLASLLLTPAIAHTDEVAALIARDRAVSGGALWDDVTSLQLSGTLHAGGLDGTFRTVHDLANQRSLTEYRLGPVEGASGYDGTRGWSRDPGGEIAVPDAPATLRRARSQAWLDAHGYWYPARLPAQFGAVQAREVDGHRLAVVEATPQQGDPVTLWFDLDTGHLRRIVQQQDQDTATTTLDDWREVAGLTLPFHITTDLTDAAGRTDQRRRTELHVAQATPNIAVAAADFAVPAMPATAHITAADGVTRVPFDLVNNHLYIDGAIDGKPARLLVDTGGMNLLTPAAAARLGLAAAGQLAARGVGEQPVDLALARARELRVGDAVLSAPVFYVVDLGDLPAVEGVHADGLVGYELFRRFGVTIDYARQLLTLAEPAKFTAPAGAHALPFELAERIPIVTGTLDGLSIRASIDTGSRVSLTLHAPFVRENDLVARYGAAPDAVVGWGVGGPSRGRPARFGRLLLGDLPIDDIAGDLYTGDKGAFASPDLAANIGGGVLRRFTVAFDYERKRLYLAPNSAYAMPDQFDRSGLWLLGADGALRVADVAAGSAAARAGLQIDDRLTALGGEPVAARTLAQWRTRLRELPAGTRLSVDYLRADRPRRAALVLADRIAAHGRPAPR